MLIVISFWGPLVGPVMSGYAAANLDWRWVYWIAAIFAGAPWPFILFCPESYGPTILKRRAKRLRKETSDPNILSPSDIEPHDLKNLMTVVLARPIRMIMYEAIVSTTCLYLSFVYAIFYMFFEAYPIIFVKTYGFSYGEEGLTFLPMGIGSALGCCIYLYWDVRLKHAKEQNKAWSAKEEYRRLPLACIAGPLLTIALFWVGWTARPDIHWIVPTLSGLSFGAGYLLLFMSLLNYVVDAYEVYAASATAATACTRSLFGAVLPFAATPMYTKLGVPWACSLLGFLSLAMCAIPFVFIRYGDAIRTRSKFSQELKARKEEMERQKEAQAQAPQGTEPEKIV